MESLILIIVEVDARDTWLRVDVSGCQVTWLRVGVSHVVPQRHLIGRVRAEEGGGVRGLVLKLLVAAVAEGPPSITNKHLASQTNT